MKRILILGGTRYFGKLLAQRLVAAGHEVTLATRGTAPDPFGKEVHRIQIDREVPFQMRAAFLGSHWDLIYDQICYSSSDAQSALEAFEGRVGHYVFMSSQSAYAGSGELHEEDFPAETHAVRMGTRSDFDYGEGKRQAEAVFAQRAPFPVSRVRYPFVLGKDDYTGRLAFHVQRIFEGKEIYFPDVSVLTSIIEAAEAARFLEWLGDQGRAGAVNACSEPIRLSELVALIENGTGKKIRYAETASEENHSPYGYPVTHFMNTDKARSWGFVFSSWKKWLPILIEEEIRKLG